MDVVIFHWFSPGSNSSLSKFSHREHENARNLISESTMLIVSLSWYILFRLNLFPARQIFKDSTITFSQVHQVHIDPPIRSINSPNYGNHIRHTCDWLDGHLASVAVKWELCTNFPSKGKKKKVEDVSKAIASKLEDVSKAIASKLYIFPQSLLSVEEYKCILVNKDNSFKSVYLTDPRVEKSGASSSSLKGFTKYRLLVVQDCNHPLHLTAMTWKDSLVKNKSK